MLFFASYAQKQAAKAPENPHRFCLSSILFRNKAILRVHLLNDPPPHSSSHARHASHWKLLEMASTQPEIRLDVSNAVAPIFALGDDDESDDDDGV